MFKKIALAALALIPTQALAFDFGFVRGPDWMDAYLAPLVAATGLTFVLTLLLKPSGVPTNEMYARVGEFSPLGRLVYMLCTLSFVALMAMVFIGMGMARYAEAGF